LWEQGGGSKWTNIFLNWEGGRKNEPLVCWFKDEKGRNSVVNGFARAVMGKPSNFKKRESGEKRRNYSERDKGGREERIEASGGRLSKEPGKKNVSIWAEIRHCRMVEKRKTMIETKAPVNFEMLFLSPGGGGDVEYQRRCFTAEKRTPSGKGGTRHHGLYS